MPDFTAGNGHGAPPIHVPGSAGGDDQAPEQMNQPAGDGRPGSVLDVPGAWVHETEAPRDTMEAADVPAQHLQGQAPDDRSTPSQFKGDAPVPPDTMGGDAPRGRESFEVDNDEAVPVFQRSSEAWTGMQFTISGPTQIARRMKGRSRCTIFVPATDMLGAAINGVTIAPDSSEVQNNGAGALGTPLFLLPGMSLTIDAEAPVWAGLIGTNTSGYVCVLTTDNPSGGQLGGL